MLIAHPLGICLLLLIGIQSITYLCLWIKPALETIQILVTSFERTLLISVVNIYKGTDDTNAQFNYQMISKQRGCFVILFFYIFLSLVPCILKSQNKSVPSIQCTTILAHVLVYSPARIKSVSISYSFRSMWLTLIL